MPPALCPNNHQVAALHQPQQGGARALPISDGSVLQEKANGKAACGNWVGNKSSRILQASFPHNLV